MPPTCPWTAGYLLSRKCIHPHNKTVVKTVHEYFRTLTSKTGFHTTAVLRPLVGIRIALGTTEKVLFYLPRHVDVFQSTRHVSLDYKACFKPVNGPPKTFQDDMDPLQTRKLSQDAHSKSPYTKAGHFRIKCQI
ncbi:hypothetical protein TNCT_403171 [Trichonephila clavata]|uniref:Uncharacterized protein n=1 Tax=Trichonephila clavata TaxID=2740835 RepID=A0A8X6HBI6_TRICU|nr:hypothetical protein TNCT_403171 [Trichonephila clavata]